MHVIKGNGKTRPWQEMVTECAQQFSCAMEERFVGSKMRAESFLSKPPTQEQMQVATEVFIDYLIGTTVGILCHGGAMDEKFEDDIVEIVRDKFARIRKMDGPPRGA